MTNSTQLLKKPWPIETDYSIMIEPNTLYEDMTRLNDLYEELLWPHDDKLTIRIEGDHIVIRNLSQEQRDMDQ